MKDDLGVSAVKETVTFSAVEITCARASRLIPRKRNTLGDCKLSANRLS